MHFVPAAAVRRIPTDNFQRPVKEMGPGHPPKAYTVRPVGGIVLLFRHIGEVPCPDFCLSVGSLPTKWRRCSTVATFSESTLPVDLRC
jgi:hypothetical protein